MFYSIHIIFPSDCVSFFFFFFAGRSPTESVERR